MFETVKQSIMGGAFELTDLLHRIDVLYASAALTDEEREQIIELAREHANPDNGLPGIADRVSALEIRVAALEQASGDNDTVADDEWPEYVKPTSKDEYYNKGDKITFEGKHYTCAKNNVANSPTELPKSWKYVEDAPAEAVEPAAGGEE